MSAAYRLIKYNSREGKPFPKVGEIIALRFSQDLFGPGSDLGIHDDLTSRATRYNYHHAIVIRIFMDVGETYFTILPMPAYSSADPVSGLSSTSWLLAQPDDFQQLHIPVPFEDDPAQPHPPFPTPTAFGLPLQITGWKSAKPSWVQVVPQAVELEDIMTLKHFEPVVVLSTDEVIRLMRYCIPHSSPVVSISVPLTGHDGSPLPGRSDDERDPSTGPSLALQTLYANDAVKHPHANVTRMVELLDSREPHEDDDYSSDDDDGDWEEADLITYARHFAATIPFLADVVKEHDRQMRELANQRVADWLERV